MMVRNPAVAAFGTAGKRPNSVEALTRISHTKLKKAKKEQQPL
jgi:hypothetical protein